MSTVFNPSYVSTLAPFRSRHSAARPAFFGALAGWLGLRRQQPRASAKPPTERKSWEQHRLAMLHAGDKMLARSRSDKQPLTLAVFDLDDLPELESVFGAAVARAATTQVVLRLQGMAGSRGLVLRTDATSFTVLMPGFGRDRVHQAIEDTMGRPCCIELDADDHEIVLVPDFKVHTFRPDSAPLAQVYAGLRQDIAAAQQLERRRQRYLQRERESHTRPADLLAQDESRPAPARPVAFRPMDATMPAPLQR